MYNFSSMRWTTPQPLTLPKPLRSHHLVYFEEYIYLTGGTTRFLNAVDTVHMPIANDEVYNSNAWRARWTDIEEAIQKAVALQPPQLGKSVWKPIADLPALQSTVVFCGNSILSVGGVKDGSPQNAIYEFVDEKVGNHWVKVGEMSVGRYRHGVVPLGKRGAVLLVAGGFAWKWHDEATVKSTSVELVLL